MRRSLLPLSMAMISAAVLGAQSPSTYSYDFRAKGDHDMDGLMGTVRVSAGRARIDVQDRNGDGQYLLVSGDGETVTIVKPNERSYTVLNADEFAHIASMGLRIAGNVVTMKLRDSDFKTERLGAGEKIAGRPTQHVRVTEHWTMDVGAMGYTKPVRQSVEMEYFYDPTLKLPRNPLMEIIASAMTVLPSTDENFAARADSVKNSLVRGTPLRTIITQREDNGRESRTVLEVTKIGTELAKDSDFKVPAGYTKKDGDLGRFKVKL
ncbi:MAG TPA: hypothetical protein VGQ30_00645 [Gemmatimonadaceae bacterium]|jgi:hypothetical protein|nr:hypothetical protein [Gemmatimonadaceae bacterium]